MAQDAVPQGQTVVHLLASRQRGQPLDRSEARLGKGSAPLG
jgi:hypothetical protein